MTERGLTVRDAAEIAGVNSSTVHDWKSGTSPHDYEAVSRLAKGLGTNLEFLLTGKHPSKDAAPSVSQVFQSGGIVFDGFAKITIERLIPRTDDEENEK